MLFMVVERFAPGRAAESCRIARERGRMLPDVALVYVDSWVSPGRDRCWQLMACDDPAPFQGWVACRGDLAEIEIVPVTPSAATAALMSRLAAEAG